jgi:glucosamine--fructose-6-phosphate aminotransferase (isomerizing)
MCGIVGYVGHQDCGGILLDGLRRLEYRGYDSAGIAIFDGEAVVRVRAEGKLANLAERFYREPVRGTTGLAHTRWATHGRPVERNAHPHTAGTITVVHNGIIENYAELREELRADGAEFASDTDTEIVAHLVARARPTSASLHAAVVHALSRVRGSYALVVLNADEPDQLVVARNASPLVLGVGQGETFAASDVPAIIAHTRDVIFLNDGDTAVLRASGAEIFGADGARVVRPVKRIQWDAVAAEKQGYKHFMLKEIHEQPARIADTLQGRLGPAHDTIELPELGMSDAELAKIERVLIVACGTSWHAGLVGRYAIEKLARVQVEVDLASEFRYRDPVIGPNTLAIAISQSGETADTLAAIREAARRGATTACVCNVIESTIARETGRPLYTHAGPEIGVASTKAFTTQIVALLMFAIRLGRARKAIDADGESELVAALRRIPVQMEGALELESTIRAFANDFKGVGDFLFLGRGVQFPIALEGALKLKEISYIHAEGYAAGEMKHGPIALIDADLPVVVLATQNSQYEKTISNLEEVRARGGRVIAIATEGDTNIAAHCEHVLYVPRAHELLESLITVVPLQLLAYCIADAKGTDVDQPRNLAKSVTVE